MARKKRILTGIQPTGSLHIGNYFGTIHPLLQEKEEIYLFLADYHALTQLPNPKDLQKRISQIAVTLLACGFDASKIVFFRHSDIPEVTELAWILGCLTPKGLLERCHSCKDKVQRGISLNMGLFSYPVLMAADILLYKADMVPVGKDQKQHLEVTRDIAIRFNRVYGDIFPIPQESIRKETGIIPGIDGQKMSKSYNNTIGIDEEEHSARKNIMRIITDSTPVDEPKNPETCNVFFLYQLFASPAETKILRQKYLDGTIGYGNAKQELFELYWEYFRSVRERKQELLKDPCYIENILKKGAIKARETATQTMREVKQAVGL